MPQQIERNANHALGDLLRRMLPKYDVRYENTQQIVNRPGLQPDVLITAPGRSPVVVEAEFMPAYTAEVDAEGRLGLEVVDTARHIDAAIALRYPDLHQGRIRPLSRHLQRPDLLLRTLFRRNTLPRFRLARWLRRRPLRSHTPRLRTPARRQRSRRCPPKGHRPRRQHSRTARPVQARRGRQHRRTARHVRCHPDLPHGRRDRRQRHGLPRAYGRDARRQTPLPALLHPGQQPQGKHPRRLDRSPQDQLLAHLRHRPGHRRSVPCCRGVPATHRTPHHRRKRRGHRRQPGPRPHRPRLPATHR